MSIANKCRNGWPVSRRTTTSIFVEKWSSYIGAILLVLVIIGLDGQRPGLGRVRRRQVVGRLVQQPDRARARCWACPQRVWTAFLMHRMSLMNISWCSALSARRCCRASSPQPPAQTRIHLGRTGRHADGHRRRTGRRLHHRRLLQPGVALVSGRLGHVGRSARGRRHRFQAADVDARKYRVGHAGRRPPCEIPESVTRRYPLDRPAGRTAGRCPGPAHGLYAGDEHLANRALIVVGGLCHRIHHAPLAPVLRPRFPRALHDRRGRDDQGRDPGAGYRHTRSAALLFQKKIIDPYIAIPADVLDRFIAGRPDFRHRHGLRRRLRLGCTLANGRRPHQTVGQHVLLRMERLHLRARCSKNSI